MSDFLRDLLPSLSTLRALGVALCWGLALSVGLYRRKRSASRAAAVAGFFWATAVFWLVLVLQAAVDGAWGLALLLLLAGAWVVWLIHGELAGL